MMSSNLAPKVAIISGDSYIKFSDEYINQNYKNIGNRYQWFNEQNSSDVPPDKNNVFKLKNFIAGTIITAKFYLDQKALTYGQN